MSTELTIDEVPEGYHYEWLPDESFKIGGDGRGCRMRGCENPAVVMLRRNHREKSGFAGFRWWPYCADHMYGRKIEDGVVKMCRLFQNELSGGERGAE